MEINIPDVVLILRCSKLEATIPCKRRYGNFQTYVGVISCAFCISYTCVTM